MADPYDHEFIEAQVRVLMAAHAAILPRGWETIRQRQYFHRLIDAWLDDYLVLVPIPADT